MHLWLGLRNKLLFQWTSDRYSRRQISLARNVEKHHRFWGARALGSWQSIQIGCRLQESVRKNTGRRVLYVVRIELTARSHILVSWSVYPNYEYHYFGMYLVHLWLVEITCRLECISAAAKLSPGRQMRPIKRPGDPAIPNYRSDWRIEKFSCQIHVQIFGYQNIQFWFQYFYVGQPKIIADHPGYHLGGPLGDPGFFVSCSIGACMINVSEWHKFGIAIVTLVFPEPGDYWGTLDYKAASVDRSVTAPTTAAANLAFPIRLLALAFIFLLSHLKLITLPMHSHTNTRHNMTIKDKFVTGTPHLADMPTAVHRQNSWNITGWSHGTASMAMHCLGYCKLTPDGVWRTTFFTQWPLWQFLTPGLSGIFFRIRHTAPLCTPWDHSCWNFINDKCNTFSFIAVFMKILGPSSSAAQIRSPGRQMRPTIRPGDP